MSRQNCIAADVGGTFAGAATFDASSARLTLGKALATPQRIVDSCVDLRIAHAPAHRFITDLQADRFCIP